MNETVRQWVQKAEDDYIVARREAAADPSPSFDAACFHAQQCIEKLMKAVLIARHVLAPRTHDLFELRRLIRTLFDWSWDDEELQMLTRAAIAYRYPTESARPEDAANALDICTRLRAELLQMIAAESTP